MEIKNLHIEGSKVTSYQEFPGTYQYAAILHCLPIQIGWYTGTLVRYQTGTKCSRPTWFPARRPWNEYPINPRSLTRAVGAFHLVRRPCPTPKSETQGIRRGFFKKKLTTDRVLIAERLHCGTAHGASGSSSAAQRTS